MRAPLLPIPLLLLVAASCAAPPLPAAVAPASLPLDPTTVIRARGGEFDPTDRDGDGIGDAYDLCPTQLEDQLGEHPLDGCPNELDPAKLAARWGRSPHRSVTVAHGQIQIDEEIRFACSSDAIDPASMPLVASIAQVLEDAPEIEILELAGHADNSGTAAENTRLTMRRAVSVMRAIVAKGVSRERLRASGYGSYCPVDGAAKSATVEDGDRRVEFRILRRDGIDLEPGWGGCAEAAAHGMKPPVLPARGRRGGPGAVDDPASECTEVMPTACKVRCKLGEAGACMVLGATLARGIEPDGKRGRPDPRGAFGALTRACVLGRLDACALGARAVRDGVGSPKDPKKALSLDTSLCAKGSAEACADLGLALHDAPEKLRDEAGSMAAYRRACELGDGGGCEALGARYWSGTVVKADRARAFDLFINACEIGRSGCAVLGDHVNEDPAALRSRARALVALHVACEQDGDTPACAAITALREMAGEYSPVPLCSAGSYASCRAACDADPAGAACLELGAALLYGTGARRKPAEAAATFEAACGKGSARGCAMSALLRQANASGAHDLRLAADQYETACVQGEPSACVNHARLQIDGLGTYRDEAMAAKMLDVACANRIGIACAHLALLTDKGVGAPTDPARARVLGELACAAGFRTSCPAASSDAVPLTMNPDALWE